MAIIPNNVFERNQVAGGRQAVEQTQLRTNAARANTPAQAAVTTRGNRPPPTPGFLVDGITNQTNQMPANFGNSGSQGYGVGAAVGDLAQRFRSVQENSPAQPPGTVGATGLNPTRRGVINDASVDFTRPFTIGGVGGAQASTPQSNPGALEGRGAATVINPPASGGPGVGVGANNPTSTPATVSDSALQGATQAGGSAAGMGYWAREGGPRNYVPGTQSAGSNLSVMGTGPSPGTPAAGGIGATGGYRPGVDPMYMDPNRGAQTQPLVMGQGGGGAGIGGLNGAIEAYLSASPGGGSEGSRNRQQLRNVMEALAGREDTATRAGATIQSANIGANTDLATTGMTQAGLDRRSTADNAIRWDVADQGWAELESGMQSDPMDQIRLGLARELAAAGDREGLFALMTNQMPRGAEPLMMDGVSTFAGYTNPDGSYRPPTMEELLSMQGIGALPRTQEQRLIQGGGR